MAITEWNYGSENGISGGLAVGDVLGIFGRENLYLATMWPYLSNYNNTPVFFAWRMYRNYDGNFSKFGDTSIKAQTAQADVDKISIYGSKDSASGQMKVMLINKQPSTTANLTLNFNNYNYTGALTGYRYAQGSSSIQTVTGLSITGTSMPVSLPAYSMTLIILPPGSGGTPPPTPTPSPIPTNFPTLTPTSTPTRTPTPTVDVRRADIDHNGNVTISDFTLLRSQYNHVCTPGMTQCADIDCNGVVDSIDSAIIQSQLGRSVGSQAPLCPYLLVTPTPSPSPIPTTFPTPTAGVLTLIDFNSLTNPERALTGQYPTGVINWGTSGWYLSGPYNLDTTNNVTFNGAGVTTSTFIFNNPRIVTSIKAFGNSGTNVSLSCTGNPTVTRTTTANTYNVITTSWTQPCSSVTLHADNGWTTNFDDLVIQ